MKLEKGKSSKPSMKVKNKDKKNSVPTEKVLHLENTKHNETSTSEYLAKYKKDSITRTMMFSIRRSKMNSEKNVEGKRTSFLELFFDLAVVFVFALIASGFAKAWHVDAEQLLGNSHKEVVSSIYISVFYWFISFIALWMTWHQYNVYVRYYGRNNLSTHVLTFLLIIGVISQGMARIISYNWFYIYALTASFLFNRFVLILWMWLAIDKKTRDSAELYRLDVLKKQTWGFVAYMFVFLGFAICNSLDLLIIHHYTINSAGVIIDHPDYNWVYLWASLFLFLAMIYELVIEFTSKNVMGEKVNKYESVIFHNKERHHLFLIITFGEMLVINLSTGTESVNLYGTLIPSLIINLIITMIIWYIYKTFIFAPEYKLNYTNRILFTFLHILVIGALTIILSSLETYSIGIHELNIKKLEYGTGTNIGLRDLEVAIDKVYPIIFLLGYIVLLASLMALVFFSQLHSGKFENAVRGTKVIFMMSMLVPIITATIMIVLVTTGIKINWLIVEGVMLVTTAGSMMTSLISVNRNLLKHDSPEDVEELLEEIHG